ncbi:MAG: branched-chain amino acid ABC transporter permease [Tabrizicola sp.]|jgi:branched-chain amino acid transport system permease protein|nr:branched-chain amino acid ABC transporter permease [Tabrizicola sp.]
MTGKTALLFGAVACLYLGTGFLQSWGLALTILNSALLVTIAALGVNIQWGYAGLFSVGTMGFTALGGLAVVLISARPNTENWQAGGLGIFLALVLGALAAIAALFAWRLMSKGLARTAVVAGLLVGGFFLFRAVFDPNVMAVEAVNPQNAGNVGGLGLPSLIAWPVGGLLAAAVAWAIGKTALGLRSDYLAIATLGIAEIIVAVIKNEDWLARGVKNITELPRPWPVPYEVDLQADPGFVETATRWGMDPRTASITLVDLLYLLLFGTVLLIVIWASERALHSPWGRMMRAIRDNEVSAAAMGKDVTGRHLQVFILGSAVIGFAGAMLTSMDGQLTPGTYNPLAFTFLVWVMVIVGGSGNNLGTVLGGLLIGWLWLVVENVGPNIMQVLTAPMPDGWLRDHLLGSAQHMRLLTMGVILLLVLRFSPRGLIPEK